MSVLEMAGKDSVKCKWNIAVDSDDIGSILTEVKEQLVDGNTALNLLVDVNRLVYKDVNQKVICKSSVNDIVQLTELCCSVIISKWVPSIDKIVVYRCLYHILNFLIIKGHAEYINKICSYIIVINELNTEKEKNGDEEKLLQNVTSLLVFNIGKSLSEFCQCLVGKSEKSLLTLCKLILKIDGLCDYANYSAFLALLLRINNYFQTNDHADLHNFQIECLNLLMPKVVKDYDKLLRVLYSILSQLVQLNLSEEDCQFLLKYAQNFAECVDKKNKKFFSLFYNIIIFLTCKGEETVFVQAVKECNLVLKDWLLNTENNNAIATSCSCGVIVLFQMRSQWLKLISDFNFSLCIVQSTIDLFNNIHNVLEMQLFEFCVLPSGEKCLLKVDGMNLIYCQYMILDLISVSGKHSTNILKQLYLPAVKSFEESLKWLDQMQQLNCPKLMVACNWTFVAIVNVSQLLITVYDEIDCIHSAFKFILSLPKEVFDAPNFPVKAQCLTACLVELAFKRGKLDECLIILAAFLCVFPQSKLEIFNLWNTIKHNQLVLEREDHLELTIYDILKGQKERLERDWSVCNFSNNEIANFVILEIQGYYENSLLRGKPLLAAFSSLRKLTGDVVLIGRALTMAMEISSSSDKYSSDLEKHLELSNKVLPMLKKQALKRRTGDIEYIIGDILYQQFRYDIRLARSKSEREVSLAANLLESQNKKMEQLLKEDINPDDKCEVNPICPNLSVKNQHILLNKLDEAFKKWETACSKQVTEKPDGIEITLENIWSAGLMYRLYCLVDKEIASWRLMYAVAKTFNNTDMRIVAVSQLLEVDPDIPQDWVDECINEINKSNLKSMFKSMFQINWVKHCLMQKKISECLPILEKNNDQWKNKKITHCSALLKMNTFQSILSGIDVDGYFPSDIVALQASLHICFSCAILGEPRTFVELTQFHDFGLQASHDLGVIYWNMKVPREARCFLKAQISIAQKLVLPLRTAQLLSVLAWVDLSAGNTTDAYVKIEGLEAILDVKYCESQHKTTTSNAYSSSSPVFVKPNIALPVFLSHKKSCNCLPCNNVVYQRMVLETVMLRAEYFNLVGDMNNTVNFFKVGIKILNELFGRRNIICNEMKNFCVRFWLQYSELQGLLRNYTGAIEANQKAKEFLNQNDYFNHSEVLLQLYNLKNSQNMVMLRSIPIKVKPVTMKKTKSPSKLEMMNFKTPANISKHFIREKTPLTNVNGSTTYTPLRPIRSLIFDSSDDDDNEAYKENNPDSQKKKTKLRTPPKIVLPPMTIIPSTKKERKLFSIFSEENDHSSTRVKKTYTRKPVLTKKTAETDMSILPSSSEADTKKKISKDVIGKSKPKTYAKKKVEDSSNSVRTTRTMRQTKASTSTTNQQELFKKNH